MKKKSAIFLVLSMSIAFLFCGCGTPMYELTAEEEELIVQYSAYTLGRFNTYQKDGMQYYNEDLYDVQTPESFPESAEEDPVNDSQGNVSMDGSGASVNNSYGNAISFADAIGYGNDLLISYQGFDLLSNYKEGNYFSIDAKPGNQLFTAKFEVKNLSDKEISVNAMEQEPTFRLSLDGGKKWVNEDVTVLTHDLSTYYGTIDASDSIACVLLFQIPSDKSVTDGDVSFSVEINGTIYPVY